MRYDTLGPINRGDLPTRQGFADGLHRALQLNDNAVILGSDVTGSLCLDTVKRQFSDRFISLGIAEQNAASVAAGLASTGIRPIFATYATFATTRALDQIRVSICYNGANAIIVGAHAGLSVGPDGATHQALEDIATMRALPAMRVIAPSDATQAQRIAEWAILSDSSNDPLYIRLGRAPVPNFYPADWAFTPYEATTWGNGGDVFFVATGGLVWECLKAATALEKEGIAASVIDMTAIKPLDINALAPALRAKLIVSAEEHQIIGGLGSAIAEWLAERASHAPLLRIGVNDSFGESGPPDLLLERFALNAASIAKRTQEALNKR